MRSARSDGAPVVEVVAVDLAAWDPADEALLSGDEHARAARFAGEALRRRFVAGRAALRRILAARTGADPARLAFRYGAQGKPALADGGATTFNLAHSGGLMLCALAENRAVGIDVERVADGDALLAIARRCFSPSEFAELAAGGAAELQPRFAACWTRKEAAIKATGLGLSTPLDAFTVPTAPGALRCAIAVPGAEGVHDLTLEAFEPACGFAAAVAAEGADWRLVRRPSAVTVPCAAPVGAP